MQIYIFLIFFIVVKLFDCDETNEKTDHKHVPPGMYIAMFPLPESTDDANTPVCISEKEPCGFYEFTISPDSLFRWQKSWCRCSFNEECVYDKTDEKRRLYELVCRPKERKKRTKSKTVVRGLRTTT